MSTVTSLRQLPLRRYDARAASIAVCELGDDGDPVLFVPGYTGGKEDFVALADDVVAAGFRYLAMDQRGQYESTAGDDAADFTIASLAEDLREIVRAIGAPVHLVGHSFGGLVARAAVIADPGLARSFTAMSSGPGILTGPRAESILALEPVLQASGAAAVYDVIEAGAAQDPTRAPSTPEVAAFMRRRFVAANPVGLAVMGRALLEVPDTVDELRATGVPLLVLHGTVDDSWAPDVQADMAWRLGARHVVIDGAEHSPAAEKPAETAAALIAFWRSTG
ncbi:MAG: alpha/beta fold hydrolase [Mycobacteriales bacterium]